MTSIKFGDLIWVRCQDVTVGHRDNFSRTSGVLRIGGIEIPPIVRL
jgi:hypothetical protein